MLLATSIGAEAQNITFDFEDSGAHTEAVSGSYTGSHTYHENGITISLYLSDVADASSRLISGDYSAMMKMASSSSKPTLIIGPIPNKGYKITQISYKGKASAGSTTLKFAYSTDNDVWNSKNPTISTSITSYSASNLSITANNVYLRFAGTSSVNNDRFISIDDIVVYRQRVSEDVTITAAKYATYCSENELNFSGTGVAAYMAKANGTGVALTEIEDGIVPAGAGVVLYSETPNTYTIPTTSATPTNYDAAENELVGITARTLVRADNGDGHTNYILSNEASGVGFYRAAADGAYLRANRAYLSTTTGSSAVAAFLSFLDDEEDDVKTIVSEQQTKHNEVFDVVGRRAVPHQRGLYIRNGKKFFVK